MTEQLSALVDNEISLEDAEHLMATIQANSHATDAWSQYHLIGDVMRGAHALSPNFKHNLMAKIDLEPTVLSPNAALLNDVQVLSESEDKETALEIKHKLPVTWSIAASFAAFMAVGWVVLQTQVTHSSRPEMLAQATLSPSTSMLVSANEQAIPAEYLMAHQASAPSASSYYIQSASYTEK
jgi:sigma-E factor negative regulatory protein RseA